MIHQLMLLDTKLRVLKEALPETSRAAFEAVDLRNEQRVALAFIKACGSRGASGDELDQHCGRGHQRISELRRAGKIIRNGEKRRTRAGKLGYVYVAR